MDLLTILLSICVIVLFFLLLRRQFGPAPAENDTSMLLLQQQLESLRADMRGSLQSISEGVDRQLALVTQQVQAQSATVGNRLDGAARAMMDVQKSLGELGQATQEMKELGESVSKLEELLRSPKIRGGLGEFLLEDLLKQVLPGDAFEMQYRFRNGQVVDAVIRTSEKIVPIDSKFPLENFRKMVDPDRENEAKAHQKTFTADVKRHIDAIASKYILPDEGTFPFALMYIPAENIYYEIIIKDDPDRGFGIYSYALEKRVIPVSPNSFYAYLQVIAFGLRGLRIEHQAREILGTLGRLDADVAKVREALGVLGNHIDNARKKFDEVDKKLGSVELKLSTATDHILPVSDAGSNLIEKQATN